MNEGNSEALIAIIKVKDDIKMAAVLESILAHAGFRGHLRAQFFQTVEHNVLAIEINPNNPTLHFVRVSNSIVVNLNVFIEDEPSQPNRNSRIYLFATLNEARECSNWYGTKAGEFATRSVTYLVSVGYLL